MDRKFSVARSILLLLAFGMVITSCKKLGRPALGDYPTDDQQLPGGDLRFYTPFDFASDEFRFQVADSISNNPSFFDATPLTIIPGVRGNGVQGSDANAIQYLNANDFGQSSSFTVSLWLKNSVPTGGKAQFAFTLTDKDNNWCNCAMFALFDHTGSGATADSAVVKFYVIDQKGENWFELTGNKRMPNIYDGNWHHIAFVYDENSSTLKFYRDGAVYQTLEWTGHGKLELTPSSVGNFILGGMNKHAGVAGPTDEWMQSWQGGIDQFRLYNKALSDSEIQALYTSKS
jgi:hypothetical protein